MDGGTVLWSVWPILTGLYTISTMIQIMSKKTGEYELVRFISNALFQDNQPQDKNSSFHHPAQHQTRHSHHLQVALPGTHIFFFFLCL